jgi:hypothetical protein
MLSCIERIESEPALSIADCRRLSYTGEWIVGYAIGGEGQGYCGDWLARDGINHHALNTAGWASQPLLRTDLSN